MTRTFAACQVACHGTVMLVADALDWADHEPPAARYRTTALCFSVRPRFSPRRTSVARLSSVTATITSAGSRTTNVGGATARTSTRRSPVSGARVTVTATVAF